MTATEVAFTVTPRIQQALQHLLDSRSTLTAEQQRQLDALPATTSPSMTLSQLQQLSSLLLTLSQPSDPSLPTTQPPIPARLHELLANSALYIPAPATRKRDPAFLSFLARQRVRQSQRDYLSLVRDLPGNGELARAVHASSVASSASEASEGNGGFGQAVGREMGEGINILTLMVTGFVVGYYGAGMLWPHSKLAPVAGGLVGLVGAMLVEVTLLMLREQRGEEMQSKRRQELRLKEEQRVAVQRIKDKEAAMERHMHEMAQQQQVQLGEEEDAPVEALEVDATIDAEDDGTGVGAILRKRKGK